MGMALSPQTEDGAAALLFSGDLGVSFGNFKQSYLRTSKDCMKTGNLIRNAIWLLACVCAQTMTAQSSSRFAITRSVVAGGGATISTGSRFQLAGTIAQPLAAVPNGARFSIQGGFWIWPAPMIFAPTKVGNDFVVSIQTEPGKTYTVQYTDSLAALNWQNLPAIAGDGTTKTVTNSAPNVTQRYYRLLEQ